MKYHHCIYLLLAISIINSGCARDPSPMKSDLEVRVNQSFQTDFDYLDQMEFYQWNSTTSTYDLVHTLKDDSVREIGLLLAESQPLADQGIDHFPVLIVLSTSEESTELNKRQKRAELYLSHRNETVILKYKDRYFEGADHLWNTLRSFGAHL